MVSDGLANTSGEQSYQMLEIITEDDSNYWMEMPNAPISKKVDRGFAAEAARSKEDLNV